ncbi:MAG: hypothetical protein PHX08_24365 [Lachnospiraceae bacterium]|nr:hypothetical protein [Lachnospiraceae bacterium]
MFHHMIQRYRSYGIAKKRDCIMYDSITNRSLDSVCFPGNETDWLNIAESTFSNTETI